MRLKLFFTIFLALLITAISISAIHYHFFKVERLRLIELNLQQNATLLLHSDLTLSKSEFSEKGQDYIEQIIGDDKINMIVAIYNDQGKVLYINDNAEIFNVPKTVSKDFEEWEDVETKDYFIKYLTVRDARQGRTVRVGMILNQSLLRWRDLNQRVFIYVSIVMVMILLMSFFLTQILFRPVQHLADQVLLMSEKIEKGEFDDLKSWFSILKKKPQQEDEYGKLIISLDKLAKKITETQEKTKRWSALMAHELKTPMTILRNRIDEMAKASQIEPERIAPVENELEKLHAIVNDFLEWASLENDTARPEIHAIPLAKRSELLTMTLKKNYPEANIAFINKEGFEQRIFCHPLHFDQVLNNLIVNSIKYGENVKVQIADNTLTVSDEGPGIPSSVLENFGKPFNKFKQGKVQGYGLGLAWVNTIAKKYGWVLDIKNIKGTEIQIVFPQN